MGTDHAYLSILEWPDAAGGQDEEQRARTLAAAAEMDIHQSRLAVRRGFPQVVARLDPLTADLAVERLHERRVMAIAPRQSDLEAAGPPRRVKRLNAALGSEPPMYLCEMWRGEPETLRTEEIFLIIRATLRSGASRTTRDRGAAGAVTAGLVVGGIPGAIVGSRIAGGGAVRHSSTRTTDMLDLHLRTGERLRIDADKFSFDVLGPSMGFTDRQNAELLLKRLRHEAPRAIVDTAFEHFRCPADVIQSYFSGASGTTRTTEAPAFDFYSAWCARMYRAMLAG